MNKQQAINAMKEGNKVTHRLFSKNEWMTMQNGYIVTEDGYKHDFTTFWRYRMHENFNDGYSLFE